MAKEYLFGQEEKNIMEIMLITLEMVMGNFIIRMVRFIRGCGKKD